MYNICPKIAVETFGGLTLLNNHMNLLIQPTSLCLVLSHEIKLQALCMLSFGCAVRGLAQL